MSQYVAAIPSDGQVGPEVQRYFEHFYTVSDTPGDHDAYADMFTGDAKLVMGPHASQGREGIIKTREGMWEKVAKRSHKPLQIFRFGSQSDEYMLHGSVEYTLKDGRSTSMDWGAKAHIVTGQSGVKMDFYQVFLDTGATARAK